MVKTALPLYPYQRQDLDALAAKFRDEKLHRVALVLPTGGGKTVCFAHQAMDWLNEHPDARVLILVDTDELVWQTAKKVARVAPHLSVGIVKAGKNETDADVIVGSVQTLRNPNRRKQLRRVSLVIVDECEMAVTASCMAILTDLGCFGGGTLAAGYTATLMRSDNKSLGTVWQDAVANRDISWMIRHRWLIPPVGRAILVPDLDLSKVASTRADFKEGELGEALAESLAPELVAKAVLEHAAGRKVLAFFPTVASAYVFAQGFEDQGIEARVIHGGMSPTERAEILAWHRPGTVLVNCMLLTKGYDDTEIDCIVMGRPTKSKRLYIQIIGRGLRVNLDRPYDGQDLLLLDVCGASGMNDLRSIVDLSDRPIKEPKEGRSLIDLEDEFDAGEGVGMDEPTFYNGDVIIREFDPLGRPSSKAWNKTKGGTFFVPAGKNGYVFIMQYPARGEWSVAWCTTRSALRMTPDAEGVPRETWPAGRPVGMTVHRGLPLDQAMVWAEDLAVEMGADGLNTTKRTAPWRKKPPTEKQKNAALGMGLMLIEGERAGALSDRMTQVTGSRRIDPLVRIVHNGG